MLLTIKRVLNFSSNYYDVIFYIAVVIFTLANFFEENYFIAGVDANFPLTLNEIDDRIEDFSFLVNNAGVGEKFNPFPYFTIIPYLYFLKLLGFLTGSIHLTQKLFFFSYFIFSYLCIRVFVAEYFNTTSQPAFFLAGISYAMNPVSDFLFTAYLPETWLTYCFFPLVLFFLIASAKRRSLAFFIIFLVTYHLFIMSMLPNAPYFLVLNVLGLSMLAIFPKVLWSIKLKLVLTTAFSLIAINFLDFYIIIQYFNSLFSGQEELFSSEKPALTSLTISSKYASILNGFRMMQLSGFHDIFWSNGIVHFSRIFYSIDKLPIFLSFVPVFIIVAGFYFEKTRDLTYLNTLILCLLILFFSKSVQPPFGSLFTLFFEHFNFFQIFRSAPEKFGLALAFLISILFAKSYDIISSQLKSYKLFIFQFILFLAILFFRLPWMNGDLISDGKGALPSFYIKVPTYYSDFEEDMKSNVNKTILHLPSDGRKYLWMMFKWGYMGVNILPHFYNRVSLISPNISGSKRSQWLRDVVSYNLGEDLQTIHKDKVDNISSLISLLGITEVILDMDRTTIHEHYISSDPQIIENNIDNKLIEIIKNKIIYGNGNLIRYVLDDSQLSNDIYIANPEFTFLNLSSIKEWNNLGFNKKSSSNIALLNKDNNIPPNTKWGSGSLTFNKVNSTKYQLDISELDGSILLVFSKEFSKWWELVHDGRIDTKHVLLNDFANGWIITPKDNHSQISNINLILNFKLQKYAQIQKLYKLFLLVISILALVYIFIRTRHINNKVPNK